MKASILEFKSESHQSINSINDELNE